jgi:hypothetical protein
MAKDKIEDGVEDAKKIKAEESSATEYVSTGNLLHRMFGKEEKIFAGEIIPKKATKIMVGIDKDQALLDHWIDRHLVMRKTDYDKKVEAEKKEADEKAKAAIRR